MRVKAPEGDTVSIAVTEIVPKEDRLPTGEREGEPEGEAKEETECVPLAHAEAEKGREAEADTVPQRVAVGQLLGLSKGVTDSEADCVPEEQPEGGMVLEAERDRLDDPVRL